ncbi:MAG: right-handed parallel beta-helix repeat-containing protein, partial [Flavobacteriaceae bacterium]|nr:right-handed parallel beta-helix repeat-containing protein [Flavobacteriaceae bacterium]
MKAIIYKTFTRILLIVALGIQIVSCTNETDPVQTTFDSTPGKAALVLPADDTQCEVGVVIANTAEVVFEWNESSATERYDLQITNLITGAVTNRPNLVVTTKTVMLERGYPYSWMVTSKNSGDETTGSDAFRFYLAGVAGSNNVPFPATLLSPLSGANVNSVDGKITLEWDSKLVDTDGDALSFTLFADTVDGNQTPPAEWQGLNETSIEISVDPNTIYYWHIETSDGTNTAISNTYTFKTGDDNPSVQGTIVSTAQELLDAIATAVPGEKIYVHGGDYVFGSTVKIDKSGSSANGISLMAYPNDATRPKLDFSSMSESSSNRGIELSADYWHVQGIDVFGAGDNGMYISGDNNLIEFCTFSENADTGLQLGNGATANTILNCDSYYNADSSLENADGFACKLDAGTNNKFMGCRAWQNLDDGWDGYLRGADNITTTY